MSEIKLYMRVIHKKNNSQRERMEREGERDRKKGIPRLCFEVIERRKK